MWPPATIGMSLSANDIILGTGDHYMAAGLCRVFICGFVICMVENSRQHNYGWIYQLTDVPVNQNQFLIFCGIDKRAPYYLCISVFITGFLFTQLKR